ASGVACLLALLGPCAYSVATAAQPHGGSAPKAGPNSASPPGRVARIGGAPVSPTLAATLHRTTTRWAAAAVGAPAAARLQLASGRPVLAVGGYTGRDPAPTLEEFRRHVAAGRIRYFLPRASPSLFGSLLGSRGVSPDDSANGAGSAALRLLTATTGADAGTGAGAGAGAGADADARPAPHALVPDPPGDSHE